MALPDQRRFVGHAQEEGLQALEVHRLVFHVQDDEVEVRRAELARRVQREVVHDGADDGIAAQQLVDRSIEPDR
ncbi:hypothetical protein D3C85_1900260 [compost metagenome]